MRICVDKDGNRFNEFGHFQYGDLNIAGNVMDFPSIVEELGLHFVDVEDIQPEGYLTDPEFYIRDDGLKTAPYIAYTLRDQETIYEIRRQQVDKKIEELIDSTAKSMRYKHIESAVGYADEPAVPQYQREGKALRAWRSLVYKKAQDIVADVLAGNRPLPSVDQVLSELPKFQDIYDATTV